MSRSQPVSPGSPPIHSTPSCPEDASHSNTTVAHGMITSLASHPRSYSDQRFPHPRSYSDQHFPFPNGRSDSYEHKQVTYPRFDYNKYSPVSIKSEQACVRCPCGNNIITPLPTPPYETATFLPPGPKSAPIAQPHNSPPLYPPRSNSIVALPASAAWHSWDPYNNSPKTSPRLRSPSILSQGGPQQTPLPGTMHSRDVRPEEMPSSIKASEETRPPVMSHIITTKPDDDKKVASSSKPDRNSFGSRFKTAMKDLFKRDPIDESKFERIQDRHWSE